MRLLLDTHVVIWLANESRPISPAALNGLEEADEVFVSFASAWEYVIKRAKGDPNFVAPFESLLTGSPAQTLHIAFDVYRKLAELPPIHADPFDRLLIAQALHHDLTLVTADAKIRGYPVRTLW